MIASAAVRALQKWRLQCRQTNSTGEERVSVQRASAGPMARFLALLLAIALAGCGSSDPAGSHSAAGVKAAAREFAADVRAGRFSAACEGITAGARAELNRMQGGCPGATEYYYLFLRGEFGNWLQRVLPNIQVEGETAVYEGRVEARYEQGRWRLENTVW